jgi:hypothetical protein
VQLQRSKAVACELWSLSLGIERCCGLQGAVVFVVCWGWGFGYVSALNLYTVGQQDVSFGRSTHCIEHPPQ